MKRRSTKAIPLLITLLLSYSNTAAAAVQCENIDIETVLEQARNAAKNDENEKASKLFRRLVKQAPEERNRFLQEYADQLTYTNNPQRAIAIYYEVLASNPPQNIEKLIKQNLALSLHWAGYHEDSLEVYNALIDQDSKNRTAIDGRNNLLITMAREDGRYNRNAEAAARFEEILAADPERRNEILREYADQLNYVKRSEEAIPLFYEVLTWDLSPIEEERARYGLALALRWSGRYDESLRYYNDLRDEGFFGYGEDRFASDRTDTLIDKARQAATVDKNLESANLFNQVIENTPEKRRDVLKEYADQLNYSGKSEEAIPLYQEVLKNPKSPEEKSTAEKGLALALNWAGELKDSLNQYESILQNSPNDTTAQKGRADVLTQLGRQNAVTDNNAEAADMLEKAIKQNPALRKDTLVELAEQLNYSNRSIEAIPLFHEVLNSNPTPEMAERAKKGLALALQWSGSYDEALSVYDQMLEDGLDDPKIAKRQAGTLIDAARKAAQASQNAESATYFERAIKLDPLRRKEVLREYADQLTYGDRAGDAIPLFYEILAADPSPEEATQARTVLGLALLWEGRLDESLRVYDKLAANNPRDKDIATKRADVLIPLARDKATKDKNEEAANLFEEVTLTVPEKKRDIRKEWADQLTYSGNPQRAINLYREGLDEDLSQDDRMSYQIGLALALFWNGQAEDALSYYEELLAEDPTNPQARHGLADILASQAALAAEENNFEKSIELMEKALATDPKRRKAFTKALADYYTETEQPLMAIPLYKETIASSTSLAEQNDSKKGLEKAEKQLNTYIQEIEECRASGNFSYIPEEEEEEVEEITVNEPKTIETAITAEIATTTETEDSEIAAVEPTSTNQHAIPMERILDLADNLIENGAPERAIELYKETLTRPLDNYDRRMVTLQLAQALQDNGDVIEAVEQYQTVLDEDSTNPTARQGIANIYAEQARKATLKGDNKMAIALFRKAISKDITRRSDLLRELADQYLADNNPEKAIPLYYEVLASSSSLENQKKATQGLSQSLILQEKARQNRSETAGGFQLKKKRN